MGSCCIGRLFRPLSLQYVHGKRTLSKRSSQCGILVSER